MSTKKAENYKLYESKLKAIDKKGDGKLSAMELLQPFGFSLKKAKDLIGKYDKNGDQVLDKEEYKDLKKEILNNERQR